MRKQRLVLISALGLAGLAAWNFPRPPARQTAPAPAPRPSTPAQPATPLHPAVAGFIAAAEAGAVRDALVKIDNLTSRLSETDSDALLRWSTGPRPAKLSADAWCALVNDVWNAVRRQEPPPPSLVPTLAAFFANPATPYVLRDYAIQHLGGYLDDDLDKLDVPQRDAILQVLKQAAAMRESGFAGTALYSLQGVKNRLAKDAPGLSEELAQAALALLADSAANKLARISALQIEIENADPRALEHARRLAADLKSEPMLRAPAIACLGRLGNPEDATLLQSIRAGCSDRRLLSALNPALARLTAGSASAR